MTPSPHSSSTLSPPPVITVSESQPFLQRLLPRKPSLPPLRPLLTQNLRLLLGLPRTAKRWLHYNLLTLLDHLDHLQLYLLPLTLLLFFISLWKLSPMAVILLLTALSEITVLCILRMANILSLWDPHH
jgi:hypothetical protein